MIDDRSRSLPLCRYKVANCDFNFLVLAIVPRPGPKHPIGNTSPGRKVGHKCFQGKIRSPQLGVIRNLTSRYPSMSAPWPWGSV